MITKSKKLQYLALQIQLFPVKRNTWPCQSAGASSWEAHTTFQDIQINCLPNHSRSKKFENNA